MLYVIQSQCGDVRQVVIKKKRQKRKAFAFSLFNSIFVLQPLFLPVRKNAWFLMKNPNSNKLQPSLSTQTCPLNLIMPQAMHYNEHVISDTKNLTTNTADIPHWAKIAQYQTACFGSNSLGAGACLTYPTRAGVSQPGPADAGRAEPRSGSRGSAPRTAPHPRLREENARPEEGVEDPAPALVG